VDGRSAENQSGTLIRYLAASYSITSGVIEGACRHVVKDRMERAGMQWTLPGEALSNLRCVTLNDDWEPFTNHCIHHETTWLYARCPLNPKPPIFAWSPERGARSTGYPLLRPDGGGQGVGNKLIS
jgi:hypothetical protein